MNSIMIKTPNDVLNGYMAADVSQKREQENIDKFCRMVRKLSPIALLLIGSLTLIMASHSGTGLGVGIPAVALGSGLGLFNLYRNNTHHVRDDHANGRNPSCDYCYNDIYKCDSSEEAFYYHS